MKKFILILVALATTCFISCNEEHWDSVDVTPEDSSYSGEPVPYVDPVFPTINSDINLDSDFYSSMNTSLESYEIGGPYCFDGFEGVPKFEDLLNQAQEKLKSVIPTYLSKVGSSYLKESGVVGEYIANVLFGPTDPTIVLLNKISGQLEQINSKLNDIIVISKKTYETLHEIEANQIYDDFNKFERRIKTLSDYNNVYFSKLSSVADMSNADEFTRRKRMAEIVTEWAWVYIDGKPAYLHALDVLREIYGFHKTWDGQSLNYFALFDKFTRGAACWENCTYQFRDAYRTHVIYDALSSIYLLITYYDSLYTSNDPSSKIPIYNLQDDVNKLSLFVQDSQYKHSKNTICLLPGHTFELSNETEGTTFFYATEYACDIAEVDGRMNAASQYDAQWGPLILYPFWQWVNVRHAKRYMNLIADYYIADCDAYKKWCKNNMPNFYRQHCIPDATIKAIINYYKGQRDAKPVSLKKMLSDGGMTFRKNGGYASCLATEKTKVLAWDHLTAPYESRNSYEVYDSYFIEGDKVSTPWDGRMTDSEGWPQASAGFHTRAGQRFWVYNSDSYSYGGSGRYTTKFTPYSVHFQRTPSDQGWNPDYKGQGWWNAVLLINKNKIVRPFEAYK